MIEMNVRSSAGMPPPGARARSINHTCITDSSLSRVDDISLEVTESVGATD